MDTQRGRASAGEMRQATQETIKTNKTRTGCAKPTETNKAWYQICDIRVAINNAYGIRR